MPDAAESAAVRITNGEWPPYLSENLSYYGIASRIISEAFALERIRVEYGFFPWVRAYEMAGSGEWDGSAVWLYATERENDFYFSEPVVSANYVFWHLKSFDFDWRTLDDLQDVVIGGTRSYFYEDIFSKLEMEGKIKLEWVSNDEQNFSKLLAGRIDLYVQDINVGKYILAHDFTPEEAGLLAYHPRSLRKDDMRLIISRRAPDSERLMLKFNHGLHRLRESGKLDAYITEMRDAPR